MRLYARLQPGVSLQQANATLSVVARRLAAAYPRTEKGAELRTFPLYAGRLGIWILTPPTWHADFSLDSPDWFFCLLV